MITVSQHHPYHYELPENLLGRDFIVSDLHGFKADLDHALQNVKFSFKTDRLISVGDLADRGPESAACLKLLEESWFFAVRGNHEQLLIDAVTNETETYWSRWLLNGGAWSLDYSKDQLNAWAQQLAQLPLTMTLPCQNKTIGICHAEFTGHSWPGSFDNNDKLAKELLWGRTRLNRKNDQPVALVDWIFSGHTIVTDIQILGNSVFIERGAYLDNGLTLIDLKEWIASHPA